MQAGQIKPWWHDLVEVAEQLHEPAAHELSGPANHPRCQSDQLALLQQVLYAHPKGKG
jgi:hypothetical protein